MKQDSASKVWLRVDNPQAAQLVADVQTRRFLEPFIGREQTVSAVATELGVYQSTLLYRVRQFIDLGLIEEVRREARRGRAIRYYRSVADNLFIPFAATSLTAQEALSPYAFSSLQQTLNRSIGRAWLDAAGENAMLGLHLFRNKNGLIAQNIVPDLAADADQPDTFFHNLLEAGAPAVWDTWGTLRLGQRDAKALQHEIAAVLGRYHVKTLSEGGEEYVVRLAMAPQKP